MDLQDALAALVVFGVLWGFQIYAAYRIRAGHSDEKTVALLVLDGALLGFLSYSLFVRDLKMGHTWLALAAAALLFAALQAPIIWLLTSSRTDSSPG